MLGTDAAVADVLADRADFAFVVLPLADSRLDIASLGVEEILLALPPGHRWAATPAVPLEEALADPSLLLSMPGHGLRAQLEREAQARGLRLESGLDLRSQRALLSLVAHGAGIAFAPRSSLAGTAGIAARPLHPRLSRELGRIVRRGRRPAPVAEILTALVRAALARGGDPA